MTIFTCAMRKHRTSGAECSESRTLGSNREGRGIIPALDSNRKASQLEKRVQATQKHIDAAYSHFETIQDSRSNAILAGLNQQARLGESTIAHQAEMASQRQEIRAKNAERRRELREELRNGHLTSA